eukprot:COSAG02_NODE_42396_length_385_cov_0.548951_1_plen_63_part_01
MQALTRKLARRYAFAHRHAASSVLLSSLHTVRLAQAGLTPFLASCMHDHTATAEALLAGGAKP